MTRCLLRFLALIFCVGFAIAAEAQVPVSGKVTDSGTGEPLVGTTVTVVGGTEAAITDETGSFSIRVPSLQAQLRFSHIGYTITDINIDGKQTVIVTLTPINASMEEVVVVGYGVQKKLTLTGAVSTIDAKKLENRPVGSVLEAMQGQVAGLTVIRTSGQPGNQSIEFRVRGTSTFSDNPVLTIVDGVPSTLDRINPADIESISVLKDAASAAIYGSRATGGVILVTTKTGKKGPPKVSLNSSLGNQTPTRFPKKLSALDHALLFNEARVNDGQSPRYSQAELDMFASPDFEQVDWDEYLLKDGLQTDHSLSVSGGGENSDYYLSFGYLNQDGTVINTRYERMNVQFNQNVRIRKNLKLGLKVGYIPSTITASSGDRVSGSLQSTAAIPINENKVKSEDGKWLARGGSGNPIASASEDGGQKVTKGTRLSGNISLEYNIIPQVKLTASYGMVRNMNRVRDFTKILTIYDQYDHDLISSQTQYNSLSIDHFSETQQNVNLLGTYTQKFNDHSVSLLGGFTAEWFDAMSEGVSTNDFLTDDIFAINAGTNDRSLWGIRGTASDWALASLVSRASYSYKDRYLLEGTVRYDGSSRFLENVRWGLFPSVSAGWVISSESFMDNVTPVNFLKLRASWGQVGNQNVGFYPFANSLALTTYYFNGQPNRGVQTAGAPNPKLTWETKSTINLGFEGRFFRNLLDINFDVFKERTSDILLALPLPTTFGQNNPVQNAGIVDNKGWELELSHRHKIGSFNYGISLQVSNVTNKVVDMGGISPIYNGNTITEEGYSINDWFGLRAIGLFQTADEVAKAPFQNPLTSPGDLRYENNGGDPNVINADDRVRLGHSTPRFPYGIRLNASFKGFDFTAFGQGVVEQLVWSNGWTAHNFDRESSTLRTYHLDRWTPENPNGRFPKTRIGSGAADDGINDKFSSFWLEDAGYFRAKNIELGYTLPSSVLKKLKIQRIRIYVNAENAFTITDYLGYDPETPIGTEARLVEGRYPLAKVYNVGLNINF